MCFEVIDNRFRQWLAVTGQQESNGLVKQGDAGCTFLSREHIEGAVSGWIDETGKHLLAVAIRTAGFSVACRLCFRHAVSQCLWAGNAGVPPMHSAPQCVIFLIQGECH